MSGPMVVWSDFGGVLTPPVTDALASVVEATGVTADTLLAAASVISAELGTRGVLEPLERGLISQAEWGERVTRVLDRRPRTDLGLLDEHWYRDRTLNRPLFDYLAGLPCRVGLLTNSVREWERHRAAIMPDTSIFAAIVRSHEHGVCKPDPEIFAIAERALDVPPERCLLVDDVLVNCEAAETRGWTAIHHTSTRTTITELDRVVLAADQGPPGIDQGRR
ncbi:HAD-IA family hydrolase [Actinokineospora xionganensis]|uniref:HAD-IA family hydrolase n=1 Tax=Actinokineospora xionganensis TaxID=2684470 RepID=A0ABR7L2F7_9PSEU|nr:HAD-IA family hydrolase [Actinokineospora xionganensis]MBC6446882.1 HAD-IA family hydrolase [Actinokineospora xionganensis]